MQYFTSIHHFYVSKSTLHIVNSYLQMQAVRLPQEFSECGPWTSRLSISRELIRNVNSQALTPTPLNQKF